jgi:hypothetical protein
VTDPYAGYERIVPVRYHDGEVRVEALIYKDSIYLCRPGTARHRNVWFSSPEDCRVVAAILLEFADQQEARSDDLTASEP